MRYLTVQKLVGAWRYTPTSLVAARRVPAMTVRFRRKVGFGRGVMYMNDKLELPETELTILESIRNLLKAWFVMWLILTFLGTVGLIVLCVEILLRG